MRDDHTLAGLQDWFARNCNGDREHRAGVQIATLDNPGWSLSIDLADTPLDGVPYEAVSVDRSEDDWYRCQVEDNVFTGWCGVRNLVELVEAFLAWEREVNRSV